MNHLLDAKELADEIEKLAVDAARYRWLRNKATHHEGVTNFFVNGKALDELCDANLSSDLTPPSWIDDSSKTRVLINVEAKEKIEIASQYKCEWQSCNDLENCIKLGRCKNMGFKIKEG